MIYGSVCSGIEAATLAWHPLGWKAAFYAEIDKFPSAVLAHHYPDVPNFGDFTTIQPDQHDAIDLLVGGTPCQSFSITGLRGGLGDDRGNLALEFLRLAQRARPRWLVWENVPGVLSSGGGRDFGAILGGMGELGYGVAYRVLDAQYVRVDGFWRAVPQRRRRVFVVGYLGDWRRAAAVLFERASLLGDNPPRRETRERIAPTISARPTGGGGLGTDFDIDGGLVAGTLGVRTTDHPNGMNSESDFIVPVAFGGNDRSGPIDVATARNGHGGPMGRLDFESEAFVAHALRAEGFDASEDGTGRGTPIIAVDWQNSAGGPNSTEAFQTLTADRTPAIAFDCKASGQNGFGIGQIASTLRSMAHSNSHQNGGGHQAVAIQERAVCENPNAGPDGAGIRDDGAAYTIEARTVPQAVQSGWAVRRLTPTECERLQAFPDNYTLIPWRGKSAPDGPRYKALGNSMAVNVMRWIGTRIELVEKMEDARAAA